MSIILVAINGFKAVQRLVGGARGYDCLPVAAAGNGAPMEGLINHFYLSEKVIASPKSFEKFIKNLAYSAKENPEKTLRRIEHNIRLYPLSPELKILKSYCLIRLGGLEEARSLLERVIKNDVQGQLKVQALIYLAKSNAWEDKPISEECQLIGQILVTAKKDWPILDSIRSSLIDIKARKEELAEMERLFRFRPRGINERYEKSIDEVMEKAIRNSELEQVKGPLSQPVPVSQAQQLDEANQAVRFLSELWEYRVAISARERSVNSKRLSSAVETIGKIPADQFPSLVSKQEIENIYNLLFSPSTTMKKYLQQVNPILLENAKTNIKAAKGFY
ncbi:MAG: hypothetical protein PHH14_02475 [Candidatus Margulisbacteria bacterium]|nr:hypothetical protein [Candidatus Margulisiibacteriota bacterium]